MSEGYNSRHWPSLSLKWHEFLLYHSVANVKLWTGGSLTLSELHSSKILTIQQGHSRRVSSIGNPRQASTGVNSGSLMAEISTTIWTKCWDSMVHLVVSSEFSKSVCVVERWESYTLTTMCYGQVGDLESLQLLRLTLSQLTLITIKFTRRLVFTTKPLGWV